MNNGKAENAKSARAPKGGAGKNRKKNANRPPAAAKTAAAGEEHVVAAPAATASKKGGKGTKKLGAKARAAVFRTIAKACDSPSMDEAINTALEGEVAIRDMMGFEAMLPALDDLLQSDQQRLIIEGRPALKDDNRFAGLSDDEEDEDAIFNPIVQACATEVGGDEPEEPQEHVLARGGDADQQYMLVKGGGIFVSEDHDLDELAESYISDLFEMLQAFEEESQIPCTYWDHSELVRKGDKCVTLDSGDDDPELVSPAGGPRARGEMPEGFSKPGPALVTIATNCKFAEYNGQVYNRHKDGEWFGTDVGTKLPEHVIVSHGLEVRMRGKLQGKYLASEGEEEVVLRSPFRLTTETSRARGYTWFKSFRQNFREAVRTAETVVSLGNSHHWERTLYTDYSERYNKFVLYLPALETLNSKVVNAVTEVNNKSLLKKLIEENEHVPQRILYDTAIYFVERRAVVQKQLSATTDACIAYLEDKRAWTQPEAHEGKDPSVDPTKRAAMPEGTYPFTSKDECIKIFKQGGTCCARMDYTTADKSYDVYEETIYENYMYEPLNEREAAKSARRGVTLSKSGLEFRTQETKENMGYQTVGTHWATQAAVITTGSTLEYQKAARRLIQGRDGDPLLRERSGKMAAQTLRYLIQMLNGERSSFNAVKELIDLTETIRLVDPAYEGQGFNTYVCDELNVDMASIKLTETDMNYCSIEAGMAFSRAMETLPGEGGRSVDAYEHLVEYIDELGAKVPERMGYVRASKAFEKESQGFLDVQMKPHEPQKVKKGKLKFGRMVVSIVGEGWIDANPTVWYDNKHLLEEPIMVRHTGDTFKVTLKGVDRYFKYPFPEAGTLKRNFYGQTVITKTRLDGLKEVLTDMEEKSELDKGMYCFCNHGDDMLSRYTNDAGKTVWCEGDLANNDSSHVDATFRQLYLVDRFRGENVKAAYAQLAYPVKFVNPNRKTEFGFFRARHGMRLPSGSVLTTYGNSRKSEGVGLAHAFYGETFMQCATKVGCEVTTVEGRLERISFLSKVFYRGLDGGIECALDLASIARKLGCIVGDAPGTRKVLVCDRIVQATREVVAGHVNEPDSLFIKSLREKFKVQTKMEKLKLALTRKVVYKESDLTYVDTGILSHYYGVEDMPRGIDEYLRCVNQLVSAPEYGATMYSRFIDKTMEVRYGMAPTVVD